MSASSKILLFGATGQLGTDIARVAREQKVDLADERVDITDAAAVTKLVEATRPTIVINSAAFHQVDKCEDDPIETFRVNAAGALYVARAARAVGARTVYVSTDYVFDGTRAAPYMWSEDDLARPLSTYGVSKLAGETETRIGDPHALIARVSSLYGVAGARGKGGNFIETILGRAKKGEGLKIVSDQTMTPTYTRDAAAAILALARGGHEGIFHVTNPLACTWHAFASKAVELCGLKVPVDPVPASTWPSKAVRPANSALATAKLQKALGGPLRPWPAALEAYLREKGHVA